MLITQSGTFTLTSDVSESIVIAAPNVVLDLNGHTVRGSGTGVGISSDQSNVTILNGSVTGFANGIVDGTGTTQSNTVSGVNVYQCSCNGIQIGSQQGTVDQCNVWDIGSGSVLDRSFGVLLWGGNLSVANSNVWDIHGIFESVGFGFNTTSISHSSISNSTADGSGATGWTFGAWSSKGQFTVSNSDFIGWAVGIASVDPGLVQDTTIANAVTATSMILQDGGGNTFNTLAPDNSALVSGTMGMDVLVGGAGNNTLIGHGGRDLLFGGDGNDDFVFQRGDGFATLLDFTPGVDTIELRSFAATSLQIGAAATGTGPVFLFNPATPTLYYDPDGAGAQPLEAIAYITSSNVLHPTDLVIVNDPSVNLMSLTAAQYLSLDPSTLTASDVVTLADAGANIAALSAAQIGDLAAANVRAIDASDDTLALTLEQFQALDTVTLTPGDTVSLADLGSVLAGLSGAELGALVGQGIDDLDATNNTLELTIAQYQALGALQLAASDTVTLTLTSVELAALSAADFTAFGLARIDILDIDGPATNASVSIDAATITAPVAATVLSFAAADTVTLLDTGATIAALSSTQFGSLAGRGVDSIDASDDTLALLLAQYLALGNVALTPEDAVTLADTGTRIATLSSQQIAALSGAGIDSIDATDDVLALTVAQYLALGDVALTPGDAVSLADTGQDIAALNPGQIGALANAHIDSIDATNNLLSLTIAQYGALGTVTLTTSDLVTLLDTGAHIAALTPGEIGALAGGGIDAIDASDNALSLTVVQYQALGGVALAAADDVTLHVTGSTDLTASSLAGIDHIALGAGVSLIAAGASFGLGKIAEVAGGAGAQSLTASGSMVDLSAVAFNQWTIGVDTIQLNGTSSADVLTGSNRDDAFAAGDGNDILTGGGGNDALDGGPGIDIAVYSGLHTQYLVKASLNGQQAQVADLRPGSPDGTDTLTGFEMVQFADRVEDIGAARFNEFYSMPGWTAQAGDFDGDGTSDLLWNNGTAGVLGTWLMQDGQIAHGFALNYDMPGWNSLVGDFNGDGTDDLLWNNGAAGVLGTWLMQGGRIAGGFALDHDMPGWNAMVGDFNGDGTDDLLWNSGANGVLGTWLMQGGQLAAGLALEHDMPGWSVAAVGDFNGDGTSDLLWSNGEQGVLGLWLMKNGAIDQTVALNHDMPGWTVAATGDFNHDGTTDLLWRNAANGMGAWIMQNGQIAGGTDAGSSAGWTPVTQGDFDHNGTGDLLWQDQQGTVSSWLTL